MRRRSALAFVLVASCGGTTQAPPSTTVASSSPLDVHVTPAVTTARPFTPFTAFELDTIRGSLGSLPAQPPADPTNRYASDDAAARLGHVFFFDTRYSSDGHVGCVTCHDPGTGFQDARANTSHGIGMTKRHASTCINSAFGSGDGTVWQFWDGRKDSLWSQALGPPEDSTEMGGTRTAIAYLIHDHYRSEWEAVFGPLPKLRDAAGKALYPEHAKPGDKAWEALSAADKRMFSDLYAKWGKAIAAYESRLVSYGSRFDDFFDQIADGATDSAALTTEEKQGLRLFIGKAGCVNCHDGATFTDWKFHNVGVAQVGPNLPAEDTGRDGGFGKVGKDEFNCASVFSDHPDKTKCEVAALEPEPGEPMLGAFKTPGLRDVSRTAPYMHTGMLATLEDVIELYDQGGAKAGVIGKLHPKIGKLGLTRDDKAALVAFLRALDGKPIPAEWTRVPTLPH